ncbi:endonuclease Q family protein [Paenibacillus sp. YN15]|uniref:endonuclease Q family protein n=1 Tax=Paenibacillus sp. YN15 TaxID=1742774 RepID=UPI000DCE76EA|nr:endonuclease Q family protein [Paenibacillus sp. YN15]RAV01039.1 TIGR00375 family protein [Paenibacillus sp. YN15]
MKELQEFYADMHIHIGRTESGLPVKISGAANLTFHNIAREASQRKGIDVVGIIDCHSPGVQAEIDSYLEKGEMEELEGGGIRYHNTTILLGSELEVKEPGRGPAHFLVFLPDLRSMKAFTVWLSGVMKNVQLSSQRIYVSTRKLQQEAESRGGILIPAHIFTPYKSVYGSAAERMSELLDVERLLAVELGLSADTEMASYLPELDGLTFLTDSDAHSLSKIGREYNRIRMAEPTYKEFVLALRNRDGRGVTGNYGLNPRLGKYHRTYCAACGSIVDEAELSTERCFYCGSTKIVRGVMDRIKDIADRQAPIVGAHRPSYHYQVPLEFLPGLGPKLLDKLLARFGTEMNILHRAPLEEIAETAGASIAGMIGAARGGALQVDAGGGGTYGRVRVDDRKG